MMTYKVSQKRLDEIKTLVNTDLSEVSDIYYDEFNICSNRLDHIEINATEIIFHDRGHNFGDGVIDETFIIIS